jgi:hypothetical protein
MPCSSQFELEAISIWINITYQVTSHNIIALTDAYLGDYHHEERDLQTGLKAGFYAPWKWNVIFEFASSSVTVPFKTVALKQ